jgi:hypothetical protein
MHLISVIYAGILLCIIGLALILGGPVRTGLFKSCKFVHKHLLLMLAERKMTNICITFVICWKFRRVNLFTMWFIPFIVALVGLVVTKFFSSAIIVSLWLKGCYLRLLILEEDVDLLRVDYVFLEKIVVCLIIMDRSITLLFIINKINFLGFSARNCLLWRIMH